MGFGLGNLVKTASGISKTFTNTTKNFRQVLGANPGALGLALPPQISLGIKIANQIGLNIPSEDVLLKKAMSTLDQATFGVYRPDTQDLFMALKGGTQSSTPGLDRYLEQLRKSGNPILDKIDLSTKSVEEQLNSIDWLY